MSKVSGSGTLRRGETLPHRGASQSCRFWHPAWPGFHPYTKGRLTLGPDNTTKFDEALPSSGAVVGRELLRATDSGSESGGGSDDDASAPGLGSGFRV